MTDDEWRAHCEAMEAEHPGLHEFLETWGRYCGAPRAVFRGHLCKMIDAMWAEASPHEADQRDAETIAEFVRISVLARGDVPMDIRKAAQKLLDAAMRRSATEGKE